ncbi:hypothetical protein EP331_14170 [bacterium]|nr:MAG: hypothetical protein EP331_14170 [bacterium]
MILLKAVRSLSQSLVLLLFFASITIAQNVPIGKWSAYPSLNNIRFLESDENSQLVWAASNGGLFSMNPNDSTVFDIYSTIDGLYLPEPNALFFDSESGMIWLGYTDGTLQSFDTTTKEITTFDDISRNSRYPSKKINHITKNDLGLLISADFGVVIWDAERSFVADSYTNFGEAGIALTINSSYLKADTLFLASDAGLIWANKNDDLILPEVWKSWGVGNGAVNGPITTITAISDTVLFCTSDRNLMYLNGGVYYYTKFKQVVKRFKQSGNHTFGITNQYVYKSNSNNFLAEIFNNTGNAGSSINDAASLGSANFLGTQTLGVYKIETATILGTNYLPTGPFLNFFSEMKMDGDLLISASTSNPGRRTASYSESGFYLYDGTTWESYNNKTNTTIKSVNGNSYYTSAISDDYYAFGSWGKGVLLYSKATDSVQAFLPSNTPELVGIESATSFMVTTGVAFDSQKNLWATNLFNTSRALYRYDLTAKEWTYYRKSTIVITDDHYFGLTIDNYGQFWIPLFNNSALGRGLFVYDIGDPTTNADDRGFQLTTDIDKGYLPSDLVTAVVQDKRGEMWIGTSRGLVRFIFPERIIGGNANDRRAEYLRNVGNDSIYFRDIDVTSIAVDAANQKWVGTSANGLWHISENGDKILKQFRTDNSPLPTNTIRSIAINDKTGLIYVATDLGLVSFVDVTTQSYSNKSSLKVYPNPLNYSTLNDNRIIIEGLSDETTVRVLSASGSLVDEFSVKGGRVQWIPLTKSGEKLASGVYFVISVDESGSEKGVGKFAVVR